VCDHLGRPGRRRVDPRVPTHRDPESCADEQRRPEQDEGDEQGRPPEDVTSFT
jgi:hypothetical protein